MDLALRSLPRQNHPDVLVGYNNSDDAGVFRLSNDTALVQTVDYFSPIVDDPFVYGQIAAANALSDIYAMGGTPKTALSIVGFPGKGLEPTVLADIMRGGLSKLDEAGVALLGGHSVRDDEVKFGYAVSGIIAIAEIRHNAGARAGDRIVLTKPLGTGLITTAAKRDKVETSHLQAAIDAMLQLNRPAAQLALEHNVHTMTDVTGFGLMGHLIEVLRASRLSAVIDHAGLPVLQGALGYSDAGHRSGGLTANRDYFGSAISIRDTVPSEFSDLVFDPQTSGGLLLFIPAERVSGLVEHLKNAGLGSSEIGWTLPADAARVDVI